MTPRERILTTLNHRMPDRLQMSYWGRPDVDRAVMGRLGLDSHAQLAERFGFDGVAGVGLGLRFPEWEARDDRVAKPGDWPGGGTEYVWHDEATFEDCWGTLWRVGRDGKYLEYVRGPLQTSTDPDEYDFPGPDRVIDAPDLASRISELKAKGCFVEAGLEQPYKTAWRLRGMEENLIDYVANPGFKERLYDRIYETWEEICRRVVSAGIDMLSIGGDIAMQDRLIMSEQVWRRVDKPRMARLIGIAKSINPDVHIFIHSDGDLRGIMDDLIEIGFDVINPIQPECMDPVETKRRWGDRITLHGCGSIQRVLPFGTTADVRRHVLRVIENCAVGGGLILGPSNNLQFDTPMENIVAFYDTALEYDLGGLA